MEKKIQDYLHLYLGCEVSTPFEPVTRTLFLTGIIGDNCYIYTDEKNKHHSGGYIYRPDQLKLKLRPLSSMTEEEMQECGNLDYDFSSDPELNTWDWQQFEPLLTSNQFIWMLSRGFDLFGLIDAGLAIPKTLPSQQ